MSLLYAQGEVRREEAARCSGVVVTAVRCVLGGAAAALARPKRAEEAHDGNGQKDHAHGDAARGVVIRHEQDSLPGNKDGHDGEKGKRDEQELGDPVTHGSEPRRSLGERNCTPTTERC